MFASHEISFIRQFPEKKITWVEDLILLSDDKQPQREWMKNPFTTYNCINFVRPYTLWKLPQTNEVFKLEVYTDNWTRNLM